MKTEVTLSNSVLTWILEQIPNPQVISDRVIDNLHKWLSGEKQPTFCQVEDASKATGIPLGYFFLTSPPNLNQSILEFRTINSEETNKLSPGLASTIHDMEMIQEWIREDMISNGEGELSFVGSKDTNTKPHDFAETIRSTLGISENWQKDNHTQISTTNTFNFLREKISNIGVTVMANGVVGKNAHHPLNVNEFRAFALCDRYAPLIFINNKDTNNGKVFSLLHELVHIWLGENNIYNEISTSTKSNKAVEILCNAVAAEILVPDEIFIRNWNVLIKQKDLNGVVNDLSSAFKCSKSVIIRKALDHKFISKQVYDKLISLAIEIHTKTASSGGNYYNTLESRIDSRFLNRLVVSLGEGKTQYSEALRLTYTNNRTFKNLTQGVDNK